jgi:hypothetical protein
MDEARKLPRSRIKPVQAQMRPDPQRAVLSFSDGSYFVETNGLVVSVFVLIKVEFSLAHLVANESMVGSQPEVALFILEQGADRVDIPSSWVVSREKCKFTRRGLN